MIIQCNSCSRKFIVKDQDIPKKGRMVQCGYCSITWHQMPVKISTEKIKKEKTKSFVETDDSPSIDNIKASDGKTYKFLGTQWAELLPSGKTGLFARKKIGQELDEITGRKERKTYRKKQRRLEEVNPSEEIGDVNGKKLPDIYKPREGLGFLGYFFLLVIIGFSVVGILKTFENDLIYYFPETKYIYQLLNEQIIYVSETFKNMILIISDLVGSY